jgi:uncharacterized membrane protein YqjE
METATDSFEPPADSSKHFARRLMAIGENRLELLMLEVQEERERLLCAILLALGVAVFGFLTGMALTVALIILLWHLSPIAVLLALTSLYATTAVWLYRRFTLLQREWKTLSSTMDQLRKDCSCLETILE